MKLNIKEIIKGCNENNPKAQNELYYMFYGYLLSISLKYIEDRAEAEDIVQDCFIKIFNEFFKFNGQTKSELSSWLRTIVKNKSIDVYRKNKKINNSEFKDYITEGINDDDEPLYDLISPYLPNLIDNLSPQYRNVVTLFYLEDKSHDEISKLLNISVGTSKSNLFKGKAKIKENILSLQLIN